MKKEELNKEFLTCDAKRAKELICLGADPHTTDSSGRNAFYKWYSGDKIILDEEKIKILMENGVSYKSSDIGNALTYLAYDECPDSVLHSMLSSGNYDKSELKDVFYFICSNERSGVNPIEVCENLKDYGFDPKEIMDILFDTNPVNLVNKDFICYLKENDVDVNQKRCVNVYNDFVDEEKIVEGYFYSSILKDNDIPLEGIFSLDSDLLKYIASGEMNNSIQLNDICVGALVNSEFIDLCIKEGDYKPLAYVINDTINEANELSTYEDNLVLKSISKLSSAQKSRLYEHLNFDNYHTKVKSNEICRLDFVEELKFAFKEESSKKEKETILSNLDNSGEEEKNNLQRRKRL
ncbi:hypothetical protein SS41_23255 [Enterobacter hormaechei subsp. xiangfangensis]|uniref:hypothetical protein n=1 Tax=Enterobacter hormaechei TaxID=158836 RepID=UPI0005F0365F|nr:hypothetical protein [Enterobacter hormaechei]KJN19175.1 hypothetical protein SS41_23255 [Enterobacter hormaechei subsp. xiangfangensis]